MTNFNWGGRELSFRKGEQVNMLSCELEPYTRPEKPTPTVYQLSSAQDLPWFYLCSTLLRSARDRAVTRLRLCIGAPSQPHRSGIGGSSEKGRTRSGLGRVLVGIKAGTANTSFRPISNPLRRFFAQSSPSHTLAMTCLYTGYEQEIPKKGTRNIQGLHKDETRNTQETPKRETRIALESTKNKTRKWHSEGDEDCFVVVPTLPDSRDAHHDGDVVNDLRVNRLILGSFRVLCEDFRCKVEPVTVGWEINQQKSLKCLGGFVSAKTKLEPVGERCFDFAQNDMHGGEEQVLRYASRFNFQIFGTSGTQRGDDIKRPMAYSLQLIALMIFCVFSSVFAQSPTKVVSVAKAKQEISTKGLVIGESLPDWFWEQELQIVNHPQKSKTIKLSAYKQQLLVLDFLNTACVPCIKSVDKWNELQPDYRLEVSVLPIHLYGDNSRIAPFAVQRGWEMPIAVGNRADTLINQLFYVRRSFGQIWIKDGRLLAIPHNKDVSRALIGRALTRRDLGIQMNDMLTYFDRRYYIKEEE